MLDKLNKVKTGAGKMLLIIFMVAVVLYFLVWPVSITPIAWKSPPNPGYTGPFARNSHLKNFEPLPIGNNHGPEDIALDAQGRLYVSTHEGFIVRLQADGLHPENWVNTGGRPLGLAFDHEGKLIVADAYKGLLSITPDAEITELAVSADGHPICYANNLDIGSDGRIYFTDSSTKFGAKEWKGTYEASLLDIFEHGAHGRLLVYDPHTGRVKTLLNGLNFANGVALSHDKTYVLVNETGNYRIIRYWIYGPNKGTSDVLVKELPSFPDNISTGPDGRFWVALISPRNPILDRLSGSPILRKIAHRMPQFLKPGPISYGHIIAIDGNGNILADLQDSEGSYPMITSVIETDDYLYLGSLIAPVFGRLSKKNSGCSVSLPYPQS